MSKKEIVLNAILSQGTLPLFFYEDATVSLEITRTLYKAGIRVFEYTNRGENALEIFTQLAASLPQYPGYSIGAGTVLKAKYAQAVIDAGDSFIVSLCYSGEVFEVCYQY